MIKVTVVIDGKSFDIDVNPPNPSAQTTSVVCNDEELTVTWPQAIQYDQMEWVIVSGRPYEIAVDPGLRSIKAFDGMHRIEVQDRRVALARPASADGRVKAPIPGLITRVLVQLGDEVEAGQPILLLEAMKMENEISAPRAGKVIKLNALTGKSVTLNEDLLEIG
ncbi:MAG: acetyl-CoA carboxylase biotin carboxyl carrier protein subunit [Caldilineales bacterium]